MVASTLILTEPRNDPPLPPMLNPAVFNPSGGDRLPAEGVVSSGFRLNPRLDPGSAGSYSLTFIQNGVYEYACLLHSAQKHVGRIIVTKNLEEEPRAADDTFGPTVGLPKVGGNGAVTLGGGDARPVRTGPGGRGRLLSSSEDRRLDSNRPSVPTRPAHRHPIGYRSRRLPAPRLRG